MKIVELDALTVVENPKIAARQGAIDKEHVHALALNYAERVSKKQDHQLQPGVVRMNEEGKPEAIVGRHRLGAVIEYNSCLTEGEEKLPFFAIVVKRGDDQALIDAITENEYRLATNVFDQADSMAKLEIFGKTRKEIATIFGLDESSVVQILKAGKLAPKYRKAVLDGDLERDAALIIADLDTDEEGKVKIFEESVRHRNVFDAILARRDTKKAKEEADHKIEAAREDARKAAEEQAKAAEALKAADKKFTEAAKEVAATKDMKDIEKKRAAQDAIIKVKKAAELEYAKLSKEYDKKKALIDAAKQEKEKLKETQASKTKVTPEQVKAIAKDAGVGIKDGRGNKKAPEKAAALPRKEVLVILEAIAEEKDNEDNYTLPASARALVGVFEALLDGEKNQRQLKNALVKYCIPDYKGK